MSFDAVDMELLFVLARRSLSYTLFVLLFTSGPGFLLSVLISLPEFAWFHAPVFFLNSFLLLTRSHRSSWS